MSVSLDGRVLSDLFRFQHGGNSFLGRWIHMIVAQKNNAMHENILIMDSGGKAQRAGDKEIPG